MIPCLKNRAKMNTSKVLFFFISSLIIFNFTVTSLGHAFSSLPIVSFTSSAFTGFLSFTLVALKIEPRLGAFYNNGTSTIANASNASEISALDNARKEILAAISMLPSLERICHYLKTSGPILTLLSEIDTDPFMFIKHHELFFTLFEIKRAEKQFIYTTLGTGIFQSLLIQPKETQQRFFFVGKKILELTQLADAVLTNVTQLHMCRSELDFDQLIQYKSMFMELNALVENLTILREKQVLAKQAFISKNTPYSREWDHKDTQVALLLSSAFQNLTKIQSNFKPLEKSEYLLGKRFISNLILQVQSKWETTYLENYKGMSAIICLGLMKTYIKLPTNEAKSTFLQSNLAHHQYPCRKAWQSSLYDSETIKHFSRLQMNILVNQYYKNLEHYWSN